MLEKTALSSDMIVAFLKDANVTGATVNVSDRRIILHVDEDSPDVSIDLTTLLGLYVEKVVGKDLSSNDFTDELKARLEEIQDQVQADWIEDTPTDKSYIKNKPDLYLPTETIRDLLDSFSDDGEGNLLYKGVPTDSVQADWIEDTPTDKSYIKNKPDLYLPTEAVREVLDALGITEDGALTYDGVVVSGIQSDYTQTDINHPAYIHNLPTLYDPANQDILNSLGETGEGILTYNGVVVDTQSQPDWDEADTTKPWFIRNKPNVYLPTNAVRNILNSFTMVDGRIEWNSNRLAYTDELIIEANTGMYGIVSDIVITTI